MQNRQVILSQYPEGIPREADFTLVDADMPAPAAGQVLCRSRYLSLDPYMRSQIAGRHISGSITPGDMMRGECVAEVVESRDPGFQPGQLVRGFGGWQSYFVLPAAELSGVPPGMAHPSWALSLLGMTGLTAWAGMVWQADVRAGERVLIPAVTGAVGSAAVQFCRLRGAEVVGTAGSEDKCRYAVEELGAVACINRKTEDLRDRLEALFPEGVNVYFDLVGGELLELASERLALHARVVLAGLMSEYNSDERAPGPPPGHWIRARATVYGLVVYDYESRRDEFIQACLPQVEAGQLFQREDIADGIDSAPAAFCRLMRGENFGKAIVRL
jgi:NADPH-dependent curcumin reductase CurA